LVIDDTEPIEFAIFKKDYRILLKRKSDFSRYYFIPLAVDSVGFAPIVRLFPLLINVLDMLGYNIKLT